MKKPTLVIFILLLFATPRVYAGVIANLHGEGPADAIKTDAGTEATGCSQNSDAIAPESTKSESPNAQRRDFVREFDYSLSPIRGNSDAPVTITVFCDFQWPFCRRLAPLLGQVLRQNPETVRVAFKNYPLNKHKYAKRAAAAALAAGEQGMFWEFHDRLYENFGRLNDEKIRGMALDLGLDVERFEQDMVSQKVLDHIKRDMKEARDARVGSTPTVFINGKPIRGKKMEEFQSAIDAELERLGNEGEE